MNILKKKMPNLQRKCKLGYRKKYILLERRILITFLRVNARINAVEKPSILIRGLECVGIALSAGFIGAAVVAAITKI